jgi:hypothetical protein
MLQRSGRSPALLIAVLAVLLAGCGAPGSSGSDAGGNSASAPFRVGLVHSITDPLASYGKQAGSSVVVFFAPGGLVGLLRRTRRAGS